jgi:hypothetical protein
MFSGDFTVSEGHGHSLVLYILIQLFVPASRSRIEVLKLEVLSVGFQDLVPPAFSMAEPASAFSVAEPAWPDGQTDVFAFFFLFFLDFFCRIFLPFS